MLTTPPSKLLSAEAAYEGALSLTWTSVAEVLRSVSGIPARLGELLLLGRKITSDQLALLLAEQKSTGEKIGVVLVRHGCITEAELAAILAMQKAPQGAQGALRLGNILLALGIVSRAQLDEAVRLQGHSGKLLGDVLQEVGYARGIDVERGLNLQRRLRQSAIAAVLSFVTLSSASLAYAAPRANTLSVSAVVLPRVTLKVISQSEQLHITHNDVARGYVDVAGGSHLAVKSNSEHGYVLAFENLPAQIRSVKISGLDSTVEIGAEGGTVVQRHVDPLAAPLQLSYRFMLASDMQPGDYSWPLSVSARSL